MAKVRGEWKEKHMWNFIVVMAVVALVIMLGNYKRPPIKQAVPIPYPMANPVNSNEKVNLVPAPTMAISLPT